MPAYRKCSVHGQHFPSLKKNVLKRTNTLYPRAQSAALLISRACGRKVLLRRMGTSSDFPGRPLSYGLNLGLGSCFKEERKKKTQTKFMRNRWALLFTPHRWKSPRVTTGYGSRPVKRALGISKELQVFPLCLKPWLHEYRKAGNKEPPCH